jgi:hypothetical protein
MKITEVAHIFGLLFPTVKVDKNVLGNILGQFVSQSLLVTLNVRLFCSVNTGCHKRKYNKHFFKFKKNISYDLATRKLYT